MVATAAGGAGLAACSASSTQVSSVGTTGSASAVPILGSTTDSSLAPQRVTKYTPPRGSAPTTAFAVGRRDFGFSRGADRPLPTRVWYPAQGAVPQSPDPVDGAAPATGRFPLIMFSHGLTSGPDDFAALLSRWAQAGFVVAAPRFPRTSYGAENFDENDIVHQPEDVEYVLNQLLALPGDPLRAVVDPNRLAAGGHSGGGITTAGLFSAHRDERLKAGLVIAGTDFQGSPFTGPTAAMLFVHGGQDDTVTFRAGHTVFEAVPWSRAMLEIPDGGHVITDDSFEAITGTTTEFWRWSLYGDTTARNRIMTAAQTGDVAELEDQL